MERLTDPILPTREESGASTFPIVNGAGALRPLISTLQLRMHWKLHATSQDAVRGGHWTESSGCGNIEVRDRADASWLKHFGMPRLRFTI